jgi:hypothetical protein
MCVYVHRDIADIPRRKANTARVYSLLTRYDCRSVRVCTQIERLTVNPRASEVCFCWPQYLMQGRKYCTDLKKNFGT